jgi:hypothetical protein
MICGPYRSQFFDRVGPPRKPKDDETIVKILLRNLVTKVARRLQPKNSRRNRNNGKEAVHNDDPNQQDQHDQDSKDVDQAHSQQTRRGRGRRGGRNDGGYYMDPGEFG